MLRSEYAPAASETTVRPSLELVLASVTPATGTPSTSRIVPVIV